MDPRLAAVFVAASHPVAAGGEREKTPTAVAATGQTLSGPQAADIVWALGLLQWIPPDDGRRRLAQLVELVERTASSKRGIEEGHITNVLWALERLEISAPPPTETKRATEEAQAGGVEETAKATVGEGPLATAEVGLDGEGEAGDTWEGSRAVRELRRRVESLPFRAIPSLFKVRDVNSE